MSRLTKILFLTMILIFVLACNVIGQPLEQVQDIAGTAQSIASAIPIETLQALPSLAPSLEALAPTAEAFATKLPNFGNYFDPQGTPVSEWNEIPVMAQATAGQEFDTNTYSFKATATVKEVQDFYNAEMAARGWEQPFTMPGEAETAIMLFQKDDSILTITITSFEGSTVVLLTRG